MTTKFKKSFSPMLICWNDIKIHLGFEDSYFVPPPTVSFGLFLDFCSKLGPGLFVNYGKEPPGVVWHPKERESGAVDEPDTQAADPK